ncbi:MAG: DegV family protein [Clostridia bacterium]|nr:DegV family protein [Clostridia bacterium]
MNKFDIYVDSAANLTDEMVASTGINVIPFICTVNGEEMPVWESGTPFAAMAKKFYGEMLAGADMKTSLIGEARFAEAVTPSLQAGKDVLIITMAEGISGTHAQAVAAKLSLEKEFPKNKIIVCDSANASLGEGLLAVSVAKLRDMGESVDACAKWFEQNKYKMNSYVTVQDLKYLKKGGRISTALAVAGTILNIKPILRADGGSPAKLTFWAKERGRKKAFDTILKQFDELCEQPENQTVAITHCDCEEEAQKLAELVKEHGARDVVIEYYDLCTGAHVGPGTIALFFMGKDRRPQALPKLQKRGKAATQKV